MVDIPVPSPENTPEFASPFKNDFKIIPSEAHPSDIPIVPEYDDENRTPLDEETVNFKATQVALAQARTSPDFVTSSQEDYIDELKQRIRLGQEENIRNELVTKKFNQYLASTQEVLQNTGNTPAEREAAIRVLTGTTIQPDNIIEDEASAALVESGASDPIRAKVLTDHPEDADRTQLFLYKTAVLDTLAQEMRDTSEKQGWAGDVYDFVEAIVPFRFQQGIRGRVPGAKTSFFQWTSDNVQNQRLALLNADKETFDAMVASIRADLKKGFIFGPNQLVNEAFINNLRFFKASDAFIEDVGQVLDISSVVPLTTAVKFIKGGSTATRLAGNRVASATMAADGIEAAKTPAADLTRTQYEDILRSSLPTSVQTDTLIGPGVAGEVATDLEARAARRAQAGQEVLDTPQVWRLNEEQLTVAFDEADARLRNTAGELHVVDIATETNPVNNTRTRVAYIGQVKDKNAGFASERAARESARRRGILPSVEETVIEGPEQLSVPKKPRLTIDGQGVFSYPIRAKNNQKIGLIDGFVDDDGFFIKNSFISKESNQGKGLGLDAYRSLASETLARGKALFSDTTVSKSAARVWEKLRGEGFKVERNPKAIFEEGDWHIPSDARAEAQWVFKVTGGPRSVTKIVEEVPGAIPSATVINRSGQWFIAFKEPVIEESSAVRRLGKIDVTKIPIVNRLQRFLQGADSLLDNVTTQRRHLAVGTQARLNQVFTEATKELRAVGRKERRVLNSALQASEQNQKWMNTAELNIFWEKEAGRPATVKELNAYYAAKDINDLDWFLHNSDLHAKLHNKGYQRVEIQMGKLTFDDHPEGKFVANGRVIDDLKKAENQYVYDSSSGTLRRPGDLFTADLERLQADGWKLVEAQNADDLYKAVGSPFRYILTHEGDVQKSILDFVQLPYVEGGHRIYQGKFFIKQGRSIVDEGTGKTFLLRPHVHFVAHTRGEAQEIAQGYETARQAWKDATKGTIDQGEATRIIQENTNLRDFDHFDQLVKEGAIDGKNKFEAVFDRQKPEVYQGRDAEFLGEFEDVDDLQEWMNNSGRLFYGRKGERLRDAAGDFAQTIDPFQTIAAGIRHAISTRAFSDLTQNVVDTWVSTFGKYLEHDRHWNRAQIFNRATFKPGTPEAIKAKAEAMRETHLSLLGTPTKATQWWNESIRQLADSIEEIGGIPGRGLARRIHNTKSRDPITALRSMAFDLKLGLFDPSQLLIQSQTAFAALSLDTVNGGRAFLSYAPLRYVLHNGTEEVLDHVAVNWKSLHGLDPEDFKSMYRDLRRSGVADISGNIALYDELSSTHLVNLATNPVSRLRELGRIPFHEGERINRIVAFTMAWRKFKKANPTAEITDQVLAGIKHESDVFAINMDRASMAWWQKGILSVPTQFLSYQARLIELMLPKMIGGSPNLRAAQKLRLAMGQFFLYGTAGIPAASWIKHQFERATGGQLDPQTEKLLFQGFWDNVIFGSLGMDTDFSARAGVWGGRNLFTDMIEGRSFLEIAGGPPFQVGGDVISSLGRFAQLRDVSFESAARLVPSMINEVAQNAVSWSRASRAVYALKYGQYLSSRSGSVITDNVNTQEAIAVLLGVPLADVTTYYEMKGSLAEQREMIQDVADTLSRQLGQMYRAEAAGRTGEADALANLNSALLQPLSPYERERAIKIAQKNAVADLGEEMGKYLEAKGADNLFLQAQADGEENSREE